MENLFAITRQPLFWLAAGLLAGYFLTRATNERNDRARTRYANWIKRHYPAVILTLVAILAIVALTFYLVEIGLSVRVLVDRLREAAKDPWTSTSELQSLASAVAILVGVLAAAATILYSSIRVWINERTATATEEGLITDRINKAVQGLGAEKATKSLHETPRYKKQGDDWERNEHGNPILARRPDGQPIIDREVIETSEPNLEVRIGAIYALERIAQDSDRDHVQIMEILCAYIRQNAPFYPGIAIPEEWEIAFDEAVNTRWDDGNSVLPNEYEVRDWVQELERPREDIQVALTVIGRRSMKQIALEGHRDSNGNWQGYRPDLRRTRLNRVDLEEANLAHARFTGSQMYGVILRNAHMEHADFQHTRLIGANLENGEMTGANLNYAQMQCTNLREAQMQRAVLSEAQMQGADLIEAQMQGADLHGAQMDASTVLSAAALRGAALRTVDYSDVSISQDQIESLFGDQTVILPEGLTRPDWPEIDEGDWHAFEKKWRAWQKEIGFDPEDPSTW